MKITKYILILIFFITIAIGQTSPNKPDSNSLPKISQQSEITDVKSNRENSVTIQHRENNQSPGKNEKPQKSKFFLYVLIPLLICLARIADVSLGTLRIILVSKGAKKLAPILGFFEVLIWLIAIGQVMQNLTNVVNYFAYATGFALGNYIGIILEQKLAIGMVVVRIITRKNASEFIESMKSTRFGLTVIEANNGDEFVNIIFMVIKRTNLPLIISHIKQFNPKAFYSVEDIRSVSNATLPANKLHPKFQIGSIFNVRKTK